MLPSLYQNIKKAAIETIQLTRWKEKLCISIVERGSDRSASAGVSQRKGQYTFDTNAYVKQIRCVLLEEQENGTTCPEVVIMRINNASSDISLFLDYYNFVRIFLSGAYNDQIPFWDYTLALNYN